MRVDVAQTHTRRIIDYVHCVGANATSNANQDEDAHRAENEKTTRINTEASGRRLAAKIAAPRSNYGLYQKQQDSINSKLALSAQ